MLHENRVLVVYGGGGAIGGATARAFAREGARVFLAGHRAESLKRTQDAIVRAGGRAEVDVVDALDERAVNAHADSVVKRAGRIDVALNAVGLMHVQGTLFRELSSEDYLHPIQSYTKTNFITAHAVARTMVKQRSGVILTLSTPGSRLAFAGHLGYCVTCAAIEAFSRTLAAELGPSGVRVVCVRPDAIPEALATSHSRQVFEPVAKRAGVTVEEILGQAVGRTLLGRLPTLDEVANCATFVASERASAMTGAVVNVTCGSVVD